MPGHALGRIRNPSHHIIKRCRGRLAGPDGRRLGGFQGREDDDMNVRYRTDCEGFHRRDFLKIGTAAGLFGLTLPQLLRLEARAAKQIVKDKASSVIMVWLAGGPATIDMWDLKPEAPDEIKGEFKPIDTKAEGVQISEHLPKMAE